MDSRGYKFIKPVLKQPDGSGHQYKKNMVSWEVHPRSQVLTPVIAEANLRAFSLESEGTPAYGGLFFSAFNNAYIKNWGRDLIAKYVLATEAGITGFLPDVADDLHNELKEKTIRVTSIGDRNIEIWGNFCKDLFAE